MCRAPSKEEISVNWVSSNLYFLVIGVLLFNLNSRRSYRFPMSRSLYRGFAGSNGRLSGQLKNISEIGLGHDFLSSFGTSKSRRSLTLCLPKLGTAGIILLALLGSLYWVVYISISSQVTIYRGYRRLQEQLVADLSVVGDLSLGISKLKELEVCTSEYENYAPCYYNVSGKLNSAESDGQIDFERRCTPRSETDQGCLVLPPKNYKIPLRWPSGRDFIWKHNVKITGKEFSSGSLTKRMMVEEEQISFHSDSLMVDGVEDYSHQIAEMIGLRNESNFNEAGVAPSLPKKLLV